MFFYFFLMFVIRNYTRTSLQLRNRIVRYSTKSLNDELKIIKEIQHKHHLNGITKESIINGNSIDIKNTIKKNHIDIDQISEDLHDHKQIFENMILDDAIQYWENTDMSIDSADALLQDLIKVKNLKTALLFARYVGLEYLQLKDHTFTDLMLLACDTNVFVTHLLYIIRLYSQQNPPFDTVNQWLPMVIIKAFNQRSFNSLTVLYQTCVLPQITEIDIRLSDDTLNTLLHGLFLANEYSKGVRLLRFMTGKKRRVEFDPLDAYIKLIWKRIEAGLIVHANSTYILSVFTSLHFKSTAKHQDRIIESFVTVLKIMDHVTILPTKSLIKNLDGIANDSFTYRNYEICYYLTKIFVSAKDSQRVLKLYHEAKTFTTTLAETTALVELVVPFFSESSVEVAENVLSDIPKDSNSYDYLNLIILSYKYAPDHSTFQQYILHKTLSDAMLLVLIHHEWRYYRYKECLSYYEKLKEKSLNSKSLEAVVDSMGYLKVDVEQVMKIVNAHAALVRKRLQRILMGHWPKEKPVQQFLSSISKPKTIQ
ncbi:hypothetical protein BC833DRAFT_594132 [Globomyces pollinis-pini]|nr:hypothetical protein BC833DRAFT_594132 [Globomyces pollinis-pini]